MKTKVFGFKSSFQWYAKFFLSLFLSNTDPLNPHDKSNHIRNPYYSSKRNNPHKRD